MDGLNEFQLIRRSAEFCLRNAETYDNAAVGRGQTGAATSGKNTMIYSITAIGAVQALEGLLQQLTGWQDAFTELDSVLKSAGHVALANRFMDVREATNALKYGDGRKFLRLSAEIARIQCNLNQGNKRYFDEDEVPETWPLVEAEPEFIRHCLNAMDDIHDALRTIGALRP